MDDPDPGELMTRLLLVLTLEQVALFVHHLEQLACYSHGYVMITWRDGQPYLIAHEASDKA